MSESGADYMEMAQLPHLVWNPIPNPCMQKLSTDLPEYQHASMIKLQELNHMTGRGIRYSDSLL